MIQTIENRIIFDLQETKTTWHPIEVMGGSGGGY